MWNNCIENVGELQMKMNKHRNFYTFFNEMEMEKKIFISCIIYPIKNMYIHNRALLFTDTLY